MIETMHWLSLRKEDVGILKQMTYQSGSKHDKS
jgi:hypothetical protein